MAAYLLTQIAEDERVARAACARDDIAEHWLWVSTDAGQVVHDVGLEEAGQAEYLSLRSTEAHPTESVSPLPTFALRHVDDDAFPLPHIARWDPSRVIVEREAKRRIVEHCQQVLTHHVDGDWGATDLAWEVLQRLVQVYADRPDFPPEWLPEVPG